jgi:DNA-binding SARP family transcriptional activator
MPAVTLLGGASLEAEHGAVAGPATHRHRVALLALLALAAPRFIGRDKLVAYLWPDRDTEHARNLLKQGVHALRRAFGESAILSARDELRLNVELVTCDLITFEAALVAGELERAVHIYAGPLLDGFHLPRA